MKRIEFPEFKNSYRIELKNLIDRSQIFRSLLPNISGNQSAHPGEEGRWTESLVTTFLREHLPPHLEVATGFIIDPKRELRSYQVDVIVYNPSIYPPLLKYGDAVVVHYKSVYACISIKYKLTLSNIKKEISELGRIADLSNRKNEIGPYLCVFSYFMDYDAGKVRKDENGKYSNKVFEFYREALSEDSPNRRKIGYTMNEIIDSVISLDGYLLHVSKGGILSGRRSATFVQQKLSEFDSALLTEILNGIYKRFGEEKYVWNVKTNNSIEWKKSIPVHRYARDIPLEFFREWS